MKVNWQLFVGLSVFYVFMTIVYWYVGGEAVGITGMLLSRMSCWHGRFLSLVYTEANRHNHAGR